MQHLLRTAILITAAATGVAALGAADMRPDQQLDSLISLPQVSVTAIKGGVLANHDDHNRCEPRRD